jgi:hypothetical protein
LVVLGIVFGCQSDIVLPPDAPLAGTYTGVYSYITDYKAGQLEKRITASVIVVFDETNYHMNLDSTIEVDHCFCAVDGQYAITEGVRLREDTWRPEPCDACDESQNPRGLFDRETKGDSLILKHLDGTTLQMLRLLKVSD